LSPAGGGSQQLFMPEGQAAFKSYINFLYTVDMNAACSAAADVITKDELIVMSSQRMSSS